MNATSGTVEGAERTLTDTTPHSLDEVENGDVVIGEDSVPYVLSGDERRPILSPEEFFAAGYEPEQVKVVEDPNLAAMPVGEPITAAITGIKAFDSATVFLGAGHYMRTWGKLDLGSGRIAAQTRTYTITWFGGFHGAAHAIFADADDAPVHQTELRRYGVDGTWIGRSDITIAWWENMSPQDAARVTRVYLFHSWAPDSFQTILDKWVAAGKSIVELITSASSVAKVIKNFV